MTALASEFERRGLVVARNRVPHDTRACLFNSFNFDFHRLRRLARADCRMVHRVDGPIGIYRGFDDGTDARIFELNRELAHATIFQSRYSLDAHRELGVELVAPVVIPNAVDSSIFYPPALARPSLDDRPLRLVATSWSDNPNKGGATLEWLDERLDPRRIELTFAGRTQAQFRRIRAVPPMPSDAVAELLRAHDAYLAPSLHDPCSNALLEALACGLPVVYARSGGHAELAGDAGIGYTTVEELMDALEHLRPAVEGLRARIHSTPMSEIADRYLEVLGV